MRVLHLGLLRLLPVRSAPLAMRRASGWWREPLIIEDELDRDHHVLSSLTSSSQTENRDLNKRTAESEASPPSARPATAPYRPSHGFCRPRGTSKPCRVGGVHYLSVRWTLVRNSCLRSTARRRVSSRAATNCGRTAISSVLATLISMPSPPAVRSQPL